MDLNLNLEAALGVKRPDAYEIRTLCQQVIDSTGYLDQNIRARVWKILLGVNRVDSYGLETAIKNTEQDLENQRVIKVDSERTCFKDDENKATLAKLLTFYCKGLHEMMVPFMLLSEPRLPEGDISNLFYAFILKFLPQTFSDEEFNSLQCSFRLYRLLLLYHDPELCWKLDKSDMGPELYSSPWFMTLWAHGTPLNVLYRLWDFFLLEDNVYINHFVALYIIIQHRDPLLAVDHSDLPTALRKVELTEESLLTTFKEAKELLKNTPRSICRLLYISCYHEKPPPKVILDQLERASCLSISPDELLSQFIPQTGLVDGTKIKFIILDCRPVDEFNSGHLATSTHINPDLLCTAEDEMKALDTAMEHLLALKGQHFCIISENQDIDVEDMESVLSTKSSKDDFVTIKKVTEEDTSLISLVKYLCSKGFPRLSQVEGGYKSIVSAITKSKNGLRLEELIQTAIPDDIVDVAITSSAKITSDMFKAGLGYGMKKLSELKTIKIRKEKQIDQALGVEESSTSSTRNTSGHTSPDVPKSASVPTETFDSFVSEVVPVKESKKNIFDGFQFQKWLPTMKKPLSTSLLSEDTAVHIQTWASGLEEDKSKTNMFISHRVSPDGTLLPRILVISLTKLYALIPDTSRIEYGTIETDYELMNLIKITSRKSVANLVVLHFVNTSGGSEPEVISYVVDEMRACITALSERSA